MCAHLLLFFTFAAGPCQEDRQEGRREAQLSQEGCLQGKFCDCARVLTTPSAGANFGASCGIFRGFIDAFVAYGTERHAHAAS